MRSVKLALALSLLLASGAVAKTTSPSTTPSVCAPAAAHVSKPSVFHGFYGAHGQGLRSGHGGGGMGGNGGCPHAEQAKAQSVAHKNLAMGKMHGLKGR